MAVLQLLIITGIIGVCGGAGHHHSTALLTVNPLGIVFGAAWLMLVFLTVRNDWTQMELPLILSLPVCYVMPIFDIVSGMAGYILYSYCVDIIADNICIRPPC